MDDLSEPMLAKFPRDIAQTFVTVQSSKSLESQKSRKGKEGERLKDLQWSLVSLEKMVEGKMRMLRWVG